MTYLEDFQAQINNRDFSKFLQLWEEYCTSDQVDSEEFQQLLKATKNSDFAKPFGKMIETALPLWQTIQDEKASFDVLALIMDLQLSNSPLLAEIALKALQEKYGKDPLFSERIRFVGLRTKESFQNALSNYKLLSHMEKGKFVYHSGGWGTGEIIEISPIRQQATIEFENVSGRKHLTFENACKALIPLEDSHFLARRFADPDLLEKEAREDAVGVIKMLLQDLGPKTASEIKDELCELVIPEEDWVKWWQGARSKLKKDPMIESPATLRDPFQLRKSELSQEDRLQKAISNKTDINELIQTAYTFLRDLPNVKKNQEVRQSLKEKLINILSQPELTTEQELQICMCLENQFNHNVEGHNSKDLIQKIENVEEAINSIEIVALKKRALTLVREYRKDWSTLFLQMLYTTKHSALRDYILKELNTGDKQKLLEKNLSYLLDHPEKYPECLIWYFQKIISKEDNTLPFSDKEGQYRCFDAFLVLLHRLEGKPEYRDLIKKMYLLISGKRYAVVRAIFDEASLEFIKEFLLLASKCQTLTDHDMKILRSLAAVKYPSLGASKAEAHEEAEKQIIWSTEAAYFRTQEQIRHIGTVEIIENAREIEVARGHGDLRENSEYKFALEKRSRLQGQLKTLSEQLGLARIITKDDIHPDEIGIGSVVDLEDSKGNKVTYTILGPWDADADRLILSIQSKLAQAMLGCKKGDTFPFRDEKYKILNFKSFLDK